jgi:hypothetical protein
MTLRAKLDKMTDEERLRFDFFMQSRFNRHQIREIIARNLKGKDRDLLTDEIVISISGLAKLFVGEVVDRAMVAMNAETANVVESETAQGLKKHHIEYALLVYYLIL